MSEDRISNPRAKENWTYDKGRSLPDGTMIPDQVCGAKRRNGSYCKAWPVRGRERCRRHGGLAKRGVEASTFKHGRNSMVVTNFAERYAERIEDPTLTDPRRSIAIHEAVCAQLDEMLQNYDGIEYRAKLKKKVERIHDATKNPNAPVPANVLLKELFEMIRDGVRETAVLSDLSEAAEKMNRAQSRFWQLAMSGSRAIAPEEFATLMMRMADIIKQEVGNDAARRILERTDAELCGGALGLAGKGPSEEPGL